MKKPSRLGVPNVSFDMYSLYVNKPECIIEWPKPASYLAVFFQILKSHQDLGEISPIKISKPQQPQNYPDITEISAKCLHG